MPFSHAKGRGFESTLRLCFVEKILKACVVNYITYIQFRVLGLVLDETNVSPMRHAFSVDHGLRKHIW